MTKAWVQAKKKRRRRMPKNKNKRQDLRIRNLEKKLYPAIEYKTKDYQESGIAVSSGGISRNPILKIAQGSESDQRIGLEVTLQRIAGSLSISRGDNTNMMRVLVVATPSTTNLGLTDVLEYGIWSVYDDMVFSSPYKLKSSSTSKSYKVMFDKTYNVRNTQTTIVDKFNCDLKGVEKQLRFDNAILASAPTNFNISVLALSDSSAAGHPTLSFNIRTKYYDL